MEAKDNGYTTCDAVGACMPFIKQASLCKFCKYKNNGKWEK